MRVESYYLKRHSYGFDFLVVLLLPEIPVNYRSLDHMEFLDLLLFPYHSKYIINSYI